MATIQNRRHVLLKILILSALPSLCAALLEGLYCGKDNCYDVLGVTRDSNKSEISKSYRKLARKFHPDKYKGEDRKDALEKFHLIASAYEILRDDAQRQDYDYLLDHPEEYYSHYYYYYSRRVAPKVDVRIVIAVSISVISFIQYFSWWSRYNSAIKSLACVPKYRIKAIDIAKKEGLIQENNKKNKRRSKEEQREQEEAAIRQVIENNADIRAMIRRQTTSIEAQFGFGGVYSKPKITDILWLQLVLFPWYLVQYILWYLRWLWKFGIKREEYGDEEKHYIMRRNLSLSQSQYEGMEAHVKEEMFSKELWIKANAVEYQEEKSEEMKLELAKNPKYRSYRRWMKNKGPGQMSFADDYD